MASRTQLRLAQITGSYGTTSGLINDQTVSAATGSQNITSMLDVVSHLASSIKRAHGADSFAENTAGVISGSRGILDFSGTSQFGSSNKATLRGTSANGAMNQIDVVGTTVALYGNTTERLAILNGGVTRLKDSAGETVFNITAAGTNQVQIGGVDADVIPGTDSASSLGVTGTRWSNLFTDAATVGGQIDAATIVTTGDVTVGGDLTVQGTTTTIDTANLTVEDQLILLNDNSNTINSFGGVVITSGSNTALTPDLFFGRLESEVFGAARVSSNSGSISELPDEGSGTNKYMQIPIQGSQLYVSGSGNKLSINEASSNTLTVTAAAALHLDAVNAINIDSAAGDVVFQDGGVDQLAIDMDSTVGEVIMQLKVDSDDLVFKQFDGTEVLRIDDDGDVKVYDDLRLTSDSSVLALGADNDFTFTHDGTSGGTIEALPLTLDSGGNLTLGAGSTAAGVQPGHIVFLSGSTQTEYGKIKMDSDTGSLILSSSDANMLVLDSPQMIILGKEYDGEQGAAVGLRVVSDATYEGAQFARSSEIDDTDYGLRIRIADAVADSFVAVSGSLRLDEAGDDGYVAIKAPTLGGSSNAYTLTLPTTNGGTSQFLQTNGSGVLTWADPATVDTKKMVLNVKGTITSGVTNLILTGSGIASGQSSEHFEELGAPNNTYTGSLCTEVNAVSQTRRFERIEMFVNGQLLVSGTTAAGNGLVVGSGDYALVPPFSNSVLSASFAFDLEEDDVVTMVIRPS